MKNKITIFLLVCVMFFTLLATAFSKDSKKEESLYNNARKHFLNKDWDKAIDQFQQLVDEFPSSRHQDEAQFWIGYCLEKKPGTQMRAFLAFDQLINNFPNSPWVDDAIIHQIALAEKFVHEGKDQYLLFLVEKLEDEGAIRQQAGIALGKLGDNRALPVLKELENHEDFAPLAKTLMERIESGTRQELKSGEKTGLPAELEFLRSSDQVTSEKTPGSWRENFLFFPTKRYRQYKAMIKKDENWSKDELINFAMWHILPTDQFEEYFALTGYDKKEWLRKYWKTRDPTPTTDINECQEEFERRINHARAHFADLWNYRHFKYLRDQHLRQGWDHAPWDARGEIYIKFGEPDFQSIAGFHQEEWTYHRYNVDFVIHQYMTNIYGNAIFPGPLSHFVHRDNLMYVDANYIFTTEFRYHHKYEGKPIKQFKLTVEPDSRADKGTILIKYMIETREFKIVQKNKHYVLKYLQQYVVFDEDMREIIRDENEVESVKTTKAAFKVDKHVRGEIVLNLVPGEYMLALKIQDQFSDKLGIYVENFVVE